MEASREAMRQIAERLEHISEAPEAIQEKAPAKAAGNGTQAG